MIDIEVDATGALQKLQQIAQASANLRPVMGAVAEVMYAAVDENFARGGRPRWLGLAASTLRRNPDRRGGQVLVSNGTLYSSISQYSDDSTAVVGPKSKYAAIHQFGGMAGRGRKTSIPARPYLALQQEDLDEIEATVSDYLAQVVG